MTVSKTAITQKAFHDRLSAISTPRQYLEFALSTELSPEQARQVAFAFLRKSGQYAPASFAFSNIQKGTLQAQEELVALLAQAANNCEKNR